MESARLPPPVVPGCRVGVAALSGPVVAARLEAGLRELERLGFEPVPAANLASRDGLFAGRDDERLAAFHALASDPSVAAIVFARGGHGLLRLLPHLDWELLARHPRAYVGYSDLTPFLLQVVQRLGLVAFHGPMVAAFEQPWWLLMPHAPLTCRLSANWEQERVQKSLPAASSDLPGSGRSPCQPLQDSGPGAVRSAETPAASTVAPSSGVCGESGCRGRR